MKAYYRIIEHGSVIIQAQILVYQELLAVSDSYSFTVA